MPNTLMSLNTHFFEFLLLKVIEKFPSNASEDNQVKQAGAHHGPWLGIAPQRSNVIGMGTALVARNAVWAHAKHVLVTNRFKWLDLMKVQCVYPLEKKKAYHFSADHWSDANPSSVCFFKSWYERFKHWFRSRGNQNLRQKRMVEYSTDERRHSNNKSSSGRIFLSQMLSLKRGHFLIQLWNSSLVGFKLSSYLFFLDVCPRDEALQMSNTANCLPVRTRFCFKTNCKR